MSFADYIIACATLKPQDDATKDKIAKICGLPCAPSADLVPNTVGDFGVWCPQCESYECVPGCSY